MLHKLPRVMAFAAVVLAIGSGGCAARHSPCPSAAGAACAGPSSGETTRRVVIAVERLDLSVALDASGAFTDGLDDDPFWFRVRLPPGHRQLTLSDDARSRCSLSLEPRPDGTEVEFKGFFLDGLSVLGVFGVYTLWINPGPGVRIRCDGAATQVLQLPWTLDISGDSLVINGVRVCRLPDVVADAPLGAVAVPGGHIAERTTVDGTAGLVRNTVIIPQSGPDGVQGEVFCPPPGVAVRGGVVCLFGTGFLARDPDWTRGWPDRLAREGYVALCPAYRCVADGSSYRETLEDVYRSVQWLQRAAPEYGAKSDEISLLGYSAGATLAMLVGFAPPESLGLPGELRPDVRVHSVIALAGAASFVSEDGELDRESARSAMIARWAGAWDAELFRRLSPASWVNPQGPALLVVHHVRDGVAPFKPWPNAVSNWQRLGLRCRLVALDGDLAPIRAHYVLRTPEDARAVGEVVNWLGRGRSSRTAVRDQQCVSRAPGPAFRDASANPEGGGTSATRSVRTERPSCFRSTAGSVAGSK